MKKMFLFIVIVVLVVGGLYGGERLYRRTRPVAAPAEKRVEATMQIIEGWDVYDIATYLEKQKITTSTTFLAFVGYPGMKGMPGFKESKLMKEFSYLKEIPNGVGLEGYLFPDTYRVYTGASVEDITRRMLQNFDAKFSPDLRAKAKAQHRSIYEVVTMASIIEKEVTQDYDRRMVADILWSRLKVGMALQVDSSVNYITRRGDASITIKDSRVDSPYNTYRYKGLPLGPIANPGLGAIMTTLDPEPNSYVYFLTTSKGEVKYASSLEEHNRNKFKFLK